MGNRATIEVKDWDGDSAVCYLYIHWLGDPDQVVTMVKKAAPIMVLYAPGYIMLSYVRQMEPRKNIWNWRSK